MAALSRLHADEFLVEEALYPELEYAFKHPLTQEVAYDTQLSDRRAEVHVALARGLEEIHAAKLDEQAALIAHHWEEAGEALEAARWHGRAAPWAARTDLNQALRHWRSVRALAGAAPESSDSLGLVCRACIGILQVGQRAGYSVREVDEVFAEGEAVARRSGDVWSLAWLTHWYAVANMQSGNLAVFDDQTEKAVTLAEQIGSPAFQMAVLVDRALRCSLLGQLHDALSELDRYVKLGTDHSQALLPEHLRWRGLQLAQLGRLDEAQDTVETLLRLGRDDALQSAEGMRGLDLAALFRAELADFVGDPANSLSSAHELMRRAEKKRCSANADKSKSVARCRAHTKRRVETCRR